MKLPRDLSGQELIKALCRDWKYQKIHQVGSHVVLQTDDPASHRLAVPAHSSLRVGTLNSILRAVAEHKGVMREDILNSIRADGV
jgi:predicted RNA binding protein YcfA (HicA-like mRNA interferase family)